MDRLNISPNLMIVTDLDQTLVDHDDLENLSLLRFNALWEAFYRHDSLLVYSTGRSPASYDNLRREKPMLTPDVTITSVGTEIAYGESMVEDEEWVHFLDFKWNRSVVVEETSKFPQLIPQPEKHQRPHKVSFNVEKDVAAKLTRVLLERLEQRGLAVKIIYSSGIALDVLPKRAGKGEALAYLIKKFEIDGKLPANILVCGDSGNDAELFTVLGVYGIMVSNAQEELLKWHEENAKHNPRIAHACERGAAGIIQAIGKFSLGPNVSPRDIMDSLKCKVEIVNPGQEIVKFYLFYERWLRADIEKSERYIQNIKSAFYPLSVIVHPSGVEQLLHQFIELFARFYGDQKGKRFRVWLDGVSSMPIGPDIWLVKFNKWEMIGEERCCCRTTTLLASNDNLPDGFTWGHVHQTWLYRPGNGSDHQMPWLM